MRQLQPGDWIDYEVVYLTMAVRPETAPEPFAPGLSLDRVERPTASYFLHLYTTVGRDYEWVDMLALSRESLESYVADPARALWVLKDEAGVELGFYQLSHDVPGLADLSYFGLLPAGIGRGLGRPLLAHAIEGAWAYPGVQEVRVNTCTLDHPRAFPLYKSVGFTPTSKQWRSRKLTRPRTLPIRRSI